MNRKEQIQEMAKLATEAYNSNQEQIYKRIAGGTEEPKNPPIAIAEAIYDAGYRKADEVRRETARGILNTFRCCKSALIDSFEIAFEALTEKIAAEYGMEVEG